MTPLLLLLLSLALVAACGLFVAAEFSFVTVKEMKSRDEERAAEGRESSKAAAGRNEVSAATKIRELKQKSDTTFKGTGSRVDRRICRVSFLSGVGTSTFVLRWAQDAALPSIRAPAAEGGEDGGSASIPAAALAWVKEMLCTRNAKKGLALKTIMKNVVKANKVERLSLARAASSPLQLALTMISNPCWIAFAKEFTLNSEMFRRIMALALAMAERRGSGAVAVAAAAAHLLFGGRSGTPRRS